MTIDIKAMRALHEKAMQGDTFAAGQLGVAMWDNIPALIDAYEERDAAKAKLAALVEASEQLADALRDIAAGEPYSAYLDSYEAALAAAKEPT